MISAPKSLPQSAVLIFLAFAVVAVTAAAESEDVTFPIFTKDNTDSDFHFSLYTGLSSGALQITPDSSNNPSSYLANKSGRVIYNKPFQLWQPSRAGNRSASFNTSFLINVYRTNKTIDPGEGIAFVIVPSTEDPPPGSDKGYLGLTNQTLDGNPSNQIVAVEFDTYKESYDPDDNHVGLDINSIKSITSTSLRPLGIEISPVKAANYTVWIDYNGIAHRINVYMAVQGEPKPGKPLLSATLDISLYVAQWSYVGFSASTGDNYELNCVLAWNLTVENLGRNKGSRLDARMIAVITAASLVFLFAIAGLIICCKYMKRKKVGDDPSVLSALKTLPGTPREFSFKELKKATNNFDEKLKLGQGGFGIVYKGVLEVAGENMEVAVKKFSRDNSKCHVDFLAELTIINRLRHKHLVKLVGWCHKNGVLLLVYDYMPHGSLDQHLFSGTDRPLLPWDRRYNIIVGVASALSYLHNEYDQKVVHRDLKASNILLDSGFNARLGDFGLARALETDRTSYVDIELGGVPGTKGYIAPECLHTGKTTRESDVYAFGAVVLETVCGRRPLCDISGFHFLVDWVWKLYREGRILHAIDLRLGSDFEPVEAERLLQLGLACSHPAPGERPKAEVVGQVISGTVAPPVLPPFKPAFTWPSAVVNEDDLATTSTSTVLTSSSYAVSSAVRTSQCLSKEVHVSSAGDFSAGPSVMNRNGQP